jgi:tetratricopeptide (TPR) repeat protein
MLLKIYAYFFNIILLPCFSERRLGTVVVQFNDSLTGMVIHTKGLSMRKQSIPLIFLLLVFFPVVPHAWSQQPVTLEEGIGQYQQENYEEAIEIFSKVRVQEPSSSQAAFFLGMSYKQVLDYQKSAVHLRDAVTLTPPVKEALVDLIDTLYQIDRLDEAKRWIGTAESVDAAPPRVAFLKGLIFAKENNNREAITAFEKSKQLEPTLSQAADFQIGVIHIKERKLDMAKVRFQSIILQDPLSDLAGFARQYQAMVEERIYQERPLRLTVGVLGGYDTNIISKPLESSSPAGITDEKGEYLSSTVRLDYVPGLEGPWLFNAQYSASSTVYSKFTHSHDSLANSFSVSPGYNFGRVALNLNASYTNALLRTDSDLVPDPDSSPGYKRYLDYISVGPAIRYFINQNNILEVFAGYEKKDYYHQKSVDERNTVGMRGYLSWIWLFKEDAFFNLRYDFANEHAFANELADVRKWDNDGHRVTLNLSLPILSEEMGKRFGPITLQLTGSVYFQNYSYEINYGPLIETRRDKVYTGSAGLTWRFWKYASMIAQYTRTESDSNVPMLYKYNRDQYSAGFEFRY